MLSDPQTFDQYTKVFTLVSKVHFSIKMWIFVNIIWKYNVFVFFSSTDGSYYWHEFPKRFDGYLWGELVLKSERKWETAKLLIGFSSARTEWNSKSSKGKRPHLTTWNTEEAELAMHKLRPREGGCSSPFALAERGTLTLGRHRPLRHSSWIAIVTMAGKERTRVTLIQNMGAMDNVIAGGISERQQWNVLILCTTASVDRQMSVGD